MDHKDLQSGSGSRCLNTMLLCLMATILRLKAICFATPVACRVLKRGLAMTGTRKELCGPDQWIGYRANQSVEQDLIPCLAWVKCKQCRRSTAAQTRLAKTHQMWVQS